jgi:hypothetical protein
MENNGLTLPSKFIFIPEISNLIEIHYVIWNMKYADFTSNKNRQHRIQEKHSVNILYTP